MVYDMIGKVKRAFGFPPPREDGDTRRLQDSAKTLDALVADLRAVETRGKPLDDANDARLSRFASRSVKAAIAGSVSQGKSTVVNAIVGRHLLPQDDGETSGVVCELSFSSNSDSAVIVRFDDTEVSIPVTRAALESAVAKPIGGGPAPDHRKVMVRLSDWPLPPELVLLDMPGSDKDAGRGINQRVTQDADVIAYVFKVDWDPDRGDRGAGQDPGHDERLLRGLADLFDNKPDSGVLLVVNGFIATPLEEGREPVMAEWLDFRDRIFPLVQARLEEKLGRNLPHIVPIAAHAALAWPREVEDFGLSGLRHALSTLGDPLSAISRARRCDDAARVLERVFTQLRAIATSQSEWEERKSKYDLLSKEREDWVKDARATIKQNVHEVIEEMQVHMREQSEDLKELARNDTIIRDSNRLSAIVNSHVTKLSSEAAEILSEKTEEVAGSRKPPIHFYGAKLLSDLDDVLCPPAQYILVPEMPNVVVALFEEARTGVNPREAARQFLIRQIEIAIDDNIVGHWEGAKRKCVSRMTRELNHPWPSLAEVGLAPTSSCFEDLMRLVKRVREMHRILKSLSQAGE